MARKDQPTRRTVLKTTAAGLSVVTGGVATVGTAAAEMTEEEADSILDKAQSILQTEGPDARAEFLRSNGIRSNHTGGTTTLSYTDQDGATTDDIGCISPTMCDGEIEVNISIDYLKKLGYYYVSLQTRYKHIHYVSEKGNLQIDMPENPKDAFGLYWNPDEWDLNRPDKLDEGMFPPEYGSWVNASVSHEEDGTGFRVDDRKVCFESPETTQGGGKEWSNWARCGVQLAPGDDHTSASTVSGEYRYTWNDSNVSIGVGAGFPTGISVTGVQNTTVKERGIGTDLDGYDLEIAASEW